MKKEEIIQIESSPMQRRTNWKFLLITLIIVLLLAIIFVVSSNIYDYIKNPKNETNVTPTIETPTTIDNPPINSDKPPLNPPDNTLDTPEDCTPDCTNKNCGDDGCRGSCGSCNLTQTCNSTGKCVAISCTPNCAGKVCGSDGCGNTCQPGCPSPQSCNSTGGCEARAMKLTNNISQYGITWYFEKEYEYGTFINGDYWVVGPVKIIKITKPSNMLGRDGTMINPAPHFYDHGYDSRISNNYSTLLDASTRLPNLVVNSNSSVVSTISNDPTNPSLPSESTYLKSAAILTVLDKAPAQNSFRPAYSGDSKIFYYSNNLRTDLLPSLAPVASTPTLSSVEAIFERPWIDNLLGWQGGRLHPYENMPTYGGSIARDTSVGALSLMLNYSAEEKRTLLIKYTQLGIDSYGLVSNGAKWGTPGGTIGVGRKLPILMAGMMLDNEYMKNVSKDYNTRTTFQEDDQTFYLTQAEKDGTYDPWNCRAGSEGCYPGYYNPYPLGTPMWTETHTRWLAAPTHEGIPGKIEYMNLTFASTKGTSLIVHLLNIEKFWNHNAFLDWSDRGSEINQQGFYGTVFANEMWGAYRNNYGCRWERDDKENLSSRGHYHCLGQSFSCSFQNSAVALVALCSQYPDQRACDYDPCNLGCDGNC